MADFTLPPTLTDTLAAVNVLLASIAESPVTQVDPPQGVEAETALNRIQQRTREVLAKGYSWNREYKFPLSPDTTGHIQLPDNCMFVGAAYQSGGRCFVVERARKLYDQVGHTFIFTAPVNVDMILKLAFEEIPEIARQYITVTAAQLFQAAFQGERIVQEVQEEYIGGILATLEAQEDEANPLNALTGNSDQIRKTFGRGVLRGY